MAYLQRDKDLFISYFQRLDYTMDTNILNLVLNLILDQFDFETGLKMFELVCDGKIKGKVLQSIDVSKNSLKFLLKYHIHKTRAALDQNEAWNFDSERSEMASVISSPSHKNRIKKLHQSLFGSVDEGGSLVDNFLESSKFFEVMKDDEEVKKDMEDMKSDYELL